MKEGSPALGLGFKNFPMDQFGVRPPRLKALARVPDLPSPRPGPKTASTTGRPIRWKGATLRNLAGDEYSALGVGRDSGGVVVADVPKGSEDARLGLRANDFIQALSDQPVRDAEDFAAKAAKLPAGRTVNLKVIRNQRKETIEFEAIGQAQFKFFSGPAMRRLGSR